MRHGIAEDCTDKSIDAARELTNEGRVICEKFAKSLYELGMFPAVIMTSPLKRAVQTAEICMSSFHVNVKLVVCKSLAPGEDGVIS